MGAVVEELDEAAFHGDADEQHDGYGHEDGEGDGVVDEGGAGVAQPDFKVGLLFVGVKEGDAFVFDFF